MFHLIIPENLKKYDEQIKAMIMEVIAFHKDVKSPLESLQSYPVNIIYSKKEQKVFNYNTINFHDTTTFNPVILVAKPTLFGEKSDFWWQMFLKEIIYLIILLPLQHILRTMA